MNEAALPTITPDHIDQAIVIVTGVHIPGIADTRDHINIDSVDTVTLSPRAAAVCALTEGLPSNNICSALCDPDAFAAKVFGTGGSSGDCTDHACNLGGFNATVTVCR